MYVKELLSEAEKKDVEVKLMGDDVKFKHAESLEEWVDAELRPYKDEIFAYLSGEDDVSAEEALPQTNRDPWPDPLAEEAFHGLAGDIARTIEPHSEADPAALLLQLLIAVGNMIRRSAHFIAERDRHYGNLFGTLVGVTSKGRKGSSWGWIKRLAELVDPEWIKECVAGGLGSGEGLIWSVRDPIVKSEPIREGNKRTGKILRYQDVITDEGVADKRLFVLEGEFSSVLQVCAREKNTLSAIIRQAWDTGNLRTLVKNAPARASDAHISAVGHITRAELRRLITDTDMANGLANRFVWFCVRRSKSLPHGGNLSDEAMAPLAGRLKSVVDFAQCVGEMRRDAAANAVWEKVYDDLSSGKPGLLGAATSRAESQTMRFAMLYALLDRSDTVRVDHLRAGLAVWTYAEQSARYIFGSAMGDPVADDILAELRRRGSEGMSRTDMRDHFSRHKGSERIGDALSLLADSGLATCRHRDTGGRKAEVWFANV